jgi:putative membrane protein
VSAADATPTDPTPADAIAHPIELTPAPRPLQVLVTGVAMGAADVVPGFSGGTVALVAGIYPRLVANIRASAHVVSLLLRMRLRALPAALRALDWVFLLVLLTGLFGAAVTLASVLERLMETEPVSMSAVFLGLVLGAAVVARHQFRAAITQRLVLVVLASAAMTALILGLRPVTLDDPALIVLAAAAAIAVCATILPGVSGAFLLLLLGVYEPVIAAVAARDLVVIGAFLGGAVTGVLSFSTLLDWLLRRAHDLVLAVLIGLMVGSARVLWPWPSGTGVGDPTLGAPTGPVLVPVVAGLVAFALVLGVDALLRRQRDG